MCRSREVVDENSLSGGSCGGARRLSNGIIAAGRADLCAIARPHLANPAWTLLEAAKIGVTDVPWPKQYRSAKVQLERNLQREKEAAAANAGLTPQEIAAKLLGS